MNNNYYQKPISDDNNFVYDNSYNVNDRKGYKSSNKNLSYVDIFNMNKGKIASFYMSNDTSMESHNNVFNGVIENASFDNVIISDPKTGKWTMLILKYLDYVIFEENINYCNSH